MAISKRARVLRRMLPRFISSEGASLERRRADLERVGKLPRPRTYTYDNAVVGGVSAIRATPKDPQSNRHILFLHGGGYMLGSAASHTGVAARLAANADATATTIDYRLAPEHPFPAGLSDCVSAAKALITEFGANNLAIAGDSAGGGATIATMCALRDEGHPLPACAFVMSPWTDLSVSGETMRSKAEIDPMITEGLIRSGIESYLSGDTPADHPQVSPLFADLAGLPPILIHVGTEEMLLSDSTRFAEAAKNADVDVEIKIWPEMWHVFHAFAGLMREANTAMADGGAFIARHAGTAKAGDNPVPVV